METLELAETFGEGKGATDAGIDVDNEEAIKLLISGAEKKCEQKKEVGFDQQMLGALQELNGKSMGLHDALKEQFAKS